MLTGTRKNQQESFSINRIREHNFTWRTKTNTQRTMVSCFFLKVCVRYFSLILKECCFWLFPTKYFEKKFNLQLFYVPIVSRIFILSWAITRCPPSQTSCFAKITVCVIETMLVTLPLTQRNKARREVN